MGNFVIIKPVITEHSMKQANKGKFTFVVDRFATKGTVKKAVADTFNVKVTAVATSVLKGKTKRVGKNRAEVPVSAFKKAIVTLEKGQKIALFEIGAPTQP